MAFHNDDEHSGQANPIHLSPSSRVQHQPAALQRTYSEPVRKSSRVSSKPVSCDDDIEILEINVLPKKPKDIEATKFGKENNKEDECITRQSKLKHDKSDVPHEIKKKSNIDKNLASNTICKENEEILLIDE